MTLGTALAQAHILAVDDNPNNLKLLRTILSEKGVHLRLATSGEMALQSARLSPPELILLDINMPGIDGFETCLRLKADPLTRAVPVIFLSSLSEGADIVRAYECGGVDFVSKPFQAEVLLARVSTQITLARIHQELLQENLERRRAEAAAEEANRMKSAFLANMSHEIRTPMNAIIGLTHLALRTTLEGRQRGYLDKIQSSSKHLLSLLNDILDFSKVEAGRLGVEHIVFDLRQVLRDVVNVTSDKADAKGLALHCVLEPEVPCALRGDPLRLAQILINYVNNAVKFTARGQVHLRASVRERSDSDALLHFAVQDSGIGLRAEQIAGLFRSFSQADASTTRQYGGTGLGLAISKGLAELMGGQVGVESVEGVGSTFWVTARLGLAQAAELAAQVAHGEAARPEPLRERRGARLLLVEDNALNQMVATELLRDAGFVVDVADHGGMALERLQAASAQADGPAERAPYALILMDMQMPVMDGLETTRHILAHPLWRSIPVVAMTANTMEGDSERCLAAGMVDFVGKPIEPERLWATLARWIAPQAAPPAAEPGAEPQAEADPDAALPPPTAIAGLQVQDGLRRVQHKAGLYRRLLQSFVQTQASAPALIRAARAEGNTRLAERTAHTLRGVAGNIGADTVAARAEQLEMTLRLGLEDAAIEQETLATEAALQPLIAALQAYLQGTSPAAALPVAAETTLHELPALVERLRALLQTDDAAAVDLLQAFEPALQRATGVRFAALAQAIQGFDFDTALGLLADGEPTAP